MALSVIMAVCLNMADGSTLCRVTGSQTFAFSVTKSTCTEISNNAINDELLRSGKDGFAVGFCSDRSDYAAATKETVKYLKDQGYKVEFKPYTEKK